MGWDECGDVAVNEFTNCTRSLFTQPHIAQSDHELWLRSLSTYARVSTLLLLFSTRHWPLRRF